MPLWTADRCMKCTSRQAEKRAYSHPYSASQGPKFGENLQRGECCLQNLTLFLTKEKRVLFSALSSSDSHTRAKRSLSAHPRGLHMSTVHAHTHSDTFMTHSDTFMYHSWKPASQLHVVWQAHLPIATMVDHVLAMVRGGIAMRNILHTSTYQRVPLGSILASLIGIQPHNINGPGISQ